MSKLAFTLAPGLAFGLLLALAAPPAHAAPAGSTAVLIEAKGGVFVRRAGHRLLRPLGQGEALQPGDAVLTGTDGQAVVRVEGKPVRLGPTSELQLTPPKTTGGRLLAAVKALFGSDEKEDLTAAGGIRSGGKRLRVLAPRGPIAESSPVVRWEAPLASRFKVQIANAQGLLLKWVVTGNQLKLADKNVQLAPGRYYATVEVLGGQGERRATVPFDVAEPAKPASR